MARTHQTSRVGNESDTQLIGPWNSSHQLLSMFFLLVLFYCDILGEVQFLSWYVTISVLGIVTC